MQVSRSFITQYFYWESEEGCLVEGVALQVVTHPYV